ncbi:hypothetical protein [Clostridium rectalis]|uniref:hypothetical protein n=1 Tax=Clostridium rectalis TaxID=2040295 RepID=UPI000F6304F8|nr:hypothetical protein [Clostridium rectalis]
MDLILYGIFLAHLYSYKAYYIKIFIFFSITFVIKRIIKQGNVDYANLIGLGGYSLTLLEFIKLINAMAKAGFRMTN